MCKLPASGCSFIGPQSKLQRSYEGLWRSVLHSMLSQHRPLIPTLLPLRFSEEVSLDHLGQQPWSGLELKTALKRLTQHAADHKLRMCLFIDGLDEYVGDELVLVEDFKLLFASPNIKICTSSRPRNLFESSFGNAQQPWRLTLHDWTGADIAEMVRLRLQDNSAFVDLVASEQQRSSFVEAINTRAEGVFLWAVLVVRELSREIAQSGSIADLEERLNALPSELGGPFGLFQAVIERSDLRYRPCMAQLLLLTLDDDRIFLEELFFLPALRRDPDLVLRQSLQIEERYRRPWNEHNSATNGYSEVYEDESEIDAIDSGHERSEAGDGQMESDNETIRSDDEELEIVDRMTERHDGEVWIGSLERDEFWYVIANPDLWPAVYPANVSEGLRPEPCCGAIFTRCYNGHSHPNDFHCQVSLATLFEDAALQVRKWCPDFVETHAGWELRFAHRSIAEYLRLPEAQQQLGILAGERFDPVLVMLRLNLAAFRTCGNLPRASSSLLLRVSNAMLCNRLRAQELWSMLDAITEAYAVDGCCASKHLLISTIHPQQSVPLWVLLFEQDVPNYIPVNFDCLTNLEENHAWFLAAAVCNSTMLVEQMWSTIPAHQVQYFGIIIIYGLTIWYEDMEEGQACCLIRMMIFSGLNLNRRQRWKPLRRLHDTDPQYFDLTFWEVYVRWYPRLLVAFGNYYELYLELIALLLDVAPPDHTFRLPAGHSTLFSALKPMAGPDGTIDGEHRWLQYRPLLVTLLHVRGYLSSDETLWAREENLVLGVGDLDSLGNPLPKWAYEVKGPARPRNSARS